MDRGQYVGKLGVGSNNTQYAHAYKNVIAFNNVLCMYVSDRHVKLHLAEDDVVVIYHHSPTSVLCIVNC